jgi:hypothetical protein
MAPRGVCCGVLLQVALKALSLKGIKDWKQLELFQREAVVLQVSVINLGRAGEGLMPR